MFLNISEDSQVVCCGWLYRATGMYRGKCTAVFRVFQANVVESCRVEFVVLFCSVVNAFFGCASVLDPSHYACHHPKTTVTYFGGAPLSTPISPAPNLCMTQVLRVTILEAEGIRNVAVLKKTDSYVAAELVTTAGKRESRTSVKKVRSIDPSTLRLDSRRDEVVVLSMVDVRPGLAPPVGR